MSMMATAAVDPRPVLDLIRKQGESSFEDALKLLEQQVGLTSTGARDALWRMLSQGLIEFTTDRHLRLPSQTALDRAAG